LIAPASFTACLSRTNTPTFTCELPSTSSNSSTLSHPPPIHRRRNHLNQHPRPSFTPCTMPPKSKAPTHIEHNVYLTSSVTFDNDKDDFGRLQIYQAFTSLDEANEFCEAKVDELALKLDIEAPTPTLDSINNDGTFRMELPLKNRNRDVVVETLIMPLMGGIIMHDKPVSRKTPKSKKTIKSKAKAKNSQASDEEEEKPDQDIDMDDGPVSPKTTKVNSRKNSKGSKQDVDAVKLLTVSSIGHQSPSSATMNIGARHSSKSSGRHSESRSTRRYPCTTTSLCTSSSLVPTCLPTCCAGSKQKSSSLLHQTSSLLVSDPCLFFLINLLCTSLPKRRSPSSVKRSQENPSSEPESLRRRSRIVMWMLKIPMMWSPLMRNCEG
jgi:hypothetical protein